jgi:hypothetical protein
MPRQPGDAGLLYTLYGPGSASGSPLAGWSHGVTGRYEASLYFGIPAFLVVAAMLATLGHYPFDTHRD